MNDASSPSSGSASASPASHASPAAPLPAGFAKPARGSLRRALFGATWRGLVLRLALFSLVAATALALSLPVLAPALMRYAARMYGYDLRTASAAFTLTDGVAVFEGLELQGLAPSGPDGVPFVARLARIEVTASPLSMARERRIASVRLVRPVLTIGDREAPHAPGARSLFDRLARALEQAPSGESVRSEVMAATGWRVDRLVIEGGEVHLVSPVADPTPDVTVAFAFEGAGLGGTEPDVRLRASAAPLVGEVVATLRPLGGEGGVRLRLDARAIDLRPLAGLLHPSQPPTLAQGELRLGGEARPVGGGAFELVLDTCELLEQGAVAFRVGRLRVRTEAPWSGATTALALVEIERPEITVRREERGCIHALGLCIFDPSAPPPARAERPRQADVSIARLRMDGGLVRFQDDGIPDAPPLLIEDIDVLGRELSTARDAAPGLFISRFAAGNAVGAGGVHARLALGGVPNGHMTAGVYGLQLSRFSRYAEVLAEVRLSAGAIAVQLDAALSGGVIDSQPRFLGDKVYVGGKGALRELPGSGGRTLASILETLRDRDDRIDVKLPVRADLQRYLEADVRLSAIARELDQLEAADASGESEAAAAFAARRAGLLAERTALRDAQRAALGVSPSAIVGEVLRQTVGGAVGGLASLFQSKRPPLGAVEVRFEPGAATLTDLDLKRIRGIATALRAEPWTGFVIRGAASAPRDGANPEELRELAESRALAVREAFVTAGAAGAQVLVGRPLPFDTTRPDRGARLEPVR